MTTGYQPALEGRAMVCLQMSRFYAAMLDINRAVTVSGVCNSVTNSTNRVAVLFSAVDTLTFS